MLVASFELVVFSPLFWFGLRGPHAPRGLLIGSIKHNDGHCPIAR
jgi:hypothetical protein